MPIKDNDISEQLQNNVKEAINTKTPLFICGGRSKEFYGNPVDAKPLEVSPHTGVISYEPTELCITVRAGTRLKDIEALLAEHQQILPFEPPTYSDNTTIGGAIAAGISGPRRAYTGSARDAILGVQMINGEGEIVTFGGQVMKNVAGYDLSRLMVRSLGTLGVLLNVSIRLLPKPSHDLTLSFSASQEQALLYFQDLRVRQYPVTGSVWYEDQVSLRVSASEKIIESTRKKIAAQDIVESLTENDTNDTFWQDIRDHKHAFFNQNDKPLWRFSLPPASEMLSRIDDNLLIEWGGAQRWAHSRTPANIIHSIAHSRRGFATSFRYGEPGTAKFPALETTVLELHKRLKTKMDPHNIFNPNRMYEGL